MRVSTKSLRRLAGKLQSSPVTGALYESADYIDSLEEKLNRIKSILTDRINHPGQSSEERAVLEDVLRTIEIVEKLEAEEV